MKLGERIKEKLHGYLTPRGFEELLGKELDEVAQLEAVASAARDLICSLSSPREPTNLAKSPAAAYLFAEKLRETLEALGGEE